MTQLHGARSGDHVRARRRHDFQQDLQNADCILSWARTWPRPPGRLPLGDEGEGARRDAHPRRPALHPHRAMADLHVPIRAGTDIAFLGGLINYVLENERVLQGVRPALHERRDARSTRTSRTPRTSTASSPASTPRPGTYDPNSWSYEGGAVAVAGRRRASTPTQAFERAHRRAGCCSGAPQTRPDAAAPALRLPDPEAPLRALHARDGRAGLRRRRSEDFLRSPRR